MPTTDKSAFITAAQKRQQFFLLTYHQFFNQNRVNMLLSITNDPAPLHRGFFMKSGCTSEIKGTGFAVLSGLLLTAAFPKINLPWVAWVSLVPLLWALRGSQPREAFRRGAQFGLAHFMALLYWLVPTMVTYGGLPFALSIGILFLFASILSFIFIAPALYGVSLAARSPVKLVFIFPLFWVGAEFLRSFLFTGFPWCLLGYSQFQNLDIIQLSDISGIYGVSGLIAFINAALFVGALALFGQTWHDHAVGLRVAVGGLAAGAILMGAAWMYGDMRIAQIDRLTAQAPKIRVAAIQGNIEQSQKWDPAFQIETIRKYIQLSLSARPQEPELVVWPESAAPFYFLAEVPPTQMVLQGVQAAGTHFLIGAPSFDLRGHEADYFNSAYLINPRGEVLGKYDKAHLVPYGEYTPFKEYLPFLGKMVEHVGDFKPGRKGQTLDMQGRKLGVQICYEIIFPALARALVQNGAELLITITNDAWYGTTAGPYQHFSLAVLRAVENRRALVRAANTGISGFIDPVGRVLDPTPLMTEAAVVHGLPLLDETTAYTRFGDVAPAGCLMGSIMMIVRELLRRRKNRSKIQID
jgi:apolipoprotein N-acyltransferase